MLNMIEIKRGVNYESVIFMSLNSSKLFKTKFEKKDLITTNFINKFKI